MLKKIAAILLPVLIFSGGLYFYLHQKKVRIPENAAIKAIPIDASYIIEYHKTLPLWKNVSQTSDIWKELLDLPFFSELNGKVKSLDSVIRENPDLGNVLESGPLFVSAHVNGMNHFNYLFICPVPASFQASLTSTLSSFKENAPSNDLQYEETSIHCIRIDEKNNFYYALSSGIFISSFSPALIKESLRQLESGISLIDNTYFTKVLNTSTEQVPASLFVNFQTFNNVSSGLFNRGFMSTMSSMQDFGEWMGLDITINPDEIIMTGFTDCDSTGTQYLNIFQHQSSRDIQAASVAAANTAFMVCQEFTDYDLFRKNYLQYLGIHNKNRGRREWVTRMEQNYGLNIEKYFYPWIRNEVAQIITEPSDSTLQNDSYVLVQATDVTEAMDKLSVLADTVASKKRVEDGDTTYMHHEIRNLNLDNLTGNIFGSSFEGVTKSWFTSVGKYIVFANNVNALKTFIYEYEGGNILEKDNNYKDYVRQHVESDAGIYVFNNISLSPVLYAKYLDKAYAADLKKYKSIFSKFHATSIQFSSMQGMFYTNFYFRRNSSYRKETAPLWQIKLDTTIAVAPRWVSDYATHGQYVLAQDKKEVVYLINNNGHVEWKKSVPGYIRGPIAQVDALRNHKLQYLFNTNDDIILLDRKGNTLNGFPVQLKYSASAPLSVLDYDNNRNYKIVIPCSNLKVYEYAINGKPVKGWTEPETKEIVKCPAHYCQVAKKDYTILVDGGGVVYAFDRKGNERLNLSNRMPQNIKDFYLIAGKTLGDSYIIAADSMGTVFKLSLSGELSTIKYLKEPDGVVSFVAGPKDNQGNGMVVFMDKTGIWAFNTDSKAELFHTTVKDAPDNKLLLLIYPDNSLRIGLVDPNNEKIYMWDNSGNIIPGFPLHGSEDFSIADMKNDGALSLVTGSDNEICVYNLQ